MKKNRTVSSDAIALGNSLQCTIKPLRAAAIAHIGDYIVEGEGMTTKIPALLEISLSTYQKWLALSPELYLIHERESGKVAATKAKAKKAKLKKAS